MESHSEITDIEQKEKVKEVKYLTENMIVIRLKDNRHMMFREKLENWELLKISSYIHTEMTFKKEE